MNATVRISHPAISGRNTAAFVSGATAFAGETAPAFGQRQRAAQRNWAGGGAISGAVGNGGSKICGRKRCATAA